MEENITVCGDVEIDAPPLPLEDVLDGALPHVPGSLGGRDLPVFLLHIQTYKKDFHRLTN